MNTPELVKTFRKIRKELIHVTSGIEIQEETFQQYYLPLIQYYREQSTLGKPYIIGIQGCQGVGKSTLTALIKLVLREMGFRIECCSIDDFYMSWSDRKKLARQLPGNPFYQVSRGMPGTHYWQQLISMLSDIKSGRSSQIPVFDKSLHGGKGDVTDKTLTVTDQLDFFILEGWCVNLPWIQAEAFINCMQQNDYVQKLYDQLDPHRVHFQKVMDFTKEYLPIWEMLNNKTVLLGEDIRWVEEWRCEQEQRMISTTGSGMTAEEIQSFVRPYIPFTWLYYSQLLENPNMVDCLLHVGYDHLPVSLKLTN